MNAELRFLNDAGPNIMELLEHLIFEALHLAHPQRIARLDGNAVTARSVRQLSLGEAPAVGGAWCSHTTNIVLILWK